MRYYSYNEYKTDPSVDPYVETVSEEYIRKTYYPYWHGKMCEKYGKDHVDNTYSFEDCLDDWIVVNWAWEVKE
jgi:hypothetical protein